MSLRLLVAIATLLSAALTHAHSTHAGPLEIEQAQARATVGNQANSAAYMEIENNGKTDEALLSASSPVADRVEIHSMSMEGDVMKMRAVDRLDIKAGTAVKMRPGQGYHLMLLGLKKPLKEGDKFPLTLHFRKAGKVKVTVQVADMTQQDTQGQGDHSGHGDHAGHDHQH